jgi:hypothetical protein
MQFLHSIIKYLVLIGIVMVLAACGGGSSSDKNDSNASKLQLSYEQIKIFAFTWRDTSGASHYRLLENPDGISGFTQVGDDIPAGTEFYDLIVPLYARVNARYILQTCFAADCEDSPTVFVSGTLAGSIGYFKASNTGARDFFGSSVSLSADGTTLAVGAPAEGSSDTGINGDQSDDPIVSAYGAVYVFIRSGDDWSQQAYVKASNTGARDFFGAAVSLSADGNTLAVGAPGEGSSDTGINGNQGDDDLIDSAYGAVYVFIRTDTDWDQQAYVKASNTDTKDFFGTSVSLSATGNTLAVGATGERSDANGINMNQGNAANGQNYGAVYVFIRSDTVWDQQAYVKASNSDASDFFGAAVSLSATGNTLAVGASGEGSDANGINMNQGNATNGQNYGAAYVFTRSDTVWSQQTYVKASNSDANDFFGAAVSLSAAGNTLAVGASGERSRAIGIDGDQGNATSGLDYGAAYVFSRDDTVWSQQAYVKASNTGVDDFFGAAVSLSADGNTLAVGATAEGSNSIGIDGEQGDASSGFASGAVYVFNRIDMRWSQQAYVKASNTNAKDFFGAAVSLSADADTLATGASGEASSTIGINGEQSDNAAFSSGAVYLY